MCTEIETKLKVDSHREIIDQLEKLGAKFLEEQSQKDCYFDDADRTLTKTDRCLRLRRQLTGNKEKIFLTYKDAKEKSDFKKRQELETEVKNADSTARLLSALGYEETLVFEKKRRIWQLGQCEVALDEVPMLGSFVEIEGPNSEKITDVQKSLGLADLPHITESYALLMKDKLEQQSSK